MQPERSRSEDLRQLAAVLRRVLQRLTRQLPSTPRMTQMDVAQAMSLLPVLEPSQRGPLSATLSTLLRDLGQRAPYLHEHILRIESALIQIEEQAEEPGT